MEAAVDAAAAPAPTAQAAAPTAPDQRLLDLGPPPAAGFHHNGTDLSPADDFFEKSNGKRSVSDFDDFGPETDVDAVDHSILSPVDKNKSPFSEGITKSNPVDGLFNPFLEHQEKAAFELDSHDILKQTTEEFDVHREARDETPTPPAEAVHDVGGLVEADVDSDSEEEWNYYKGDSANKENEDPLTKPIEKVVEQEEEPLAEQQPAATAAAVTSTDIDDDAMSQLNPDAAEFVPVSPVRGGPASVLLAEDAVIACSPKRPPAAVDVTVPDEREFEAEVRSRPSDVDENTFRNGHGDEDHPSETGLIQNLLNGKNIDEIPEFQPGSTPSKLASDEFHFGPNAAPFTPSRQILDQSEAALSTKAVFGDESIATLGTTFNESTVDNPETVTSKESDPMSMSFYAEKGDSGPFDLNEIHMLPNNIDEFLRKDESQNSQTSEINETLSNLAEQNLLGEPTVNNDDAIQTTDLDKASVDDEKELASPLEPEKDLEDLEAKSPQPTQENLLGDDLMCQRPGSISPRPLSVSPRLDSPSPRLDSPSPRLDSPSPKPDSTSPRPISASPQPTSISESKSPIPKDNQSYELSKSPIWEKTIPETDVDEVAKELAIDDLLLIPERPESKSSDDGELPQAVSPVCRLPRLESPVCELPQSPEVCELPKSPEECVLPKSPETCELRQLETQSPDVCKLGLSKSPIPAVLEQPKSPEPVKSPDVSNVQPPISPDIGNLEQSKSPDVCILEPSKSPDVCNLELTKSPDVCNLELPKSPDVCSFELSKSPDLPESKSPICDISESKSPVSDLLGQESPIQEAESQQDDITSSVKDDISSPVQNLLSPAKSPELQQLIEDSFVVEQQPNVNFAQEISEALQESVPENVLELNSPLPNVPDVASPLGQALTLDHPLSRCVYPLPVPVPTVNEGQHIEVKTENIAPQFAEQAVVTPSEESKHEDIIPSAPLLEGPSEEPKPDVVQEAIEHLQAPEIVAVPVEEKKIVEEKPAEKKEVKKAAATAEKKPAKSPALGKVSPTAKATPRTSTGAAKTATPKSTTTPKAAPAKTGATRMSTTPTARPPPATKTTPKPKTSTTATAAAKTLDKKPLMNGDVKKLPPATRKPPTETKTAVKPLSATAPKASPTKPAPRPATAPRTGAPKPAAAPRPATAASAAVPKPRPTTLTSRTTATKTSGVSKTATDGAKPATSPRAAAPAPKPKPPATITSAKPKAPITRTITKTPPDTAKQQKESVNKLTASRTMTSARSTTATAKTTTTTVRRVESKVSAARTIASKTTTTTMKSTTAKKPAEITRTSKTRATPTKVEKPKENGVPNTTTVEEITIVNNSINVGESIDMQKDNSPIDNKLIVDNTLIQTNTAD